MTLDIYGSLKNVLNLWIFRLIDPKNVDHNEMWNKSNNNNDYETKTYACKAFTEHIYSICVQIIRKDKLEMHKG